MFGKKEKWDERKDRGENWRENKKLGCLVRGKNREKRKLERRKKKICGAHKKLKEKIGWLQIYKINLILNSLSKAKK